jgi:phosphoglycerate dehydrogenase-like enzyme
MSAAASPAGGPFRVGLTRDLLTPTGDPSFGAAPLALLESEPGVRWEYLSESLDEITPAIAARYDALYVNAPRVTRASVAGADCRLRLIARHGVGYDSVDVAALTDRGIVLTNTPVAIRRPVAVAALTLLFALSGRLFAKDRLTRSGRWNERTGHMGLGLTTRTLGVIGVGGIGRELLRLAAPFGWRMLAADPFVDDATVASLGATRLPLDAMLPQCDFVVSVCILNDTTRHLLNRARFASMKREAFLVNVARGPVVDEAALIEALRSGAIAGAGLDVFEQEPVDPANPLLAMDNVIVTPHALCWTDECFHAIAMEGLGCVRAMARGERPGSMVNPQAWTPA